jgi:hypothetical protein
MIAPNISSPIVEIAMNAIIEEGPYLPAEELARVRSILDQFSRLQISYQDCLSLLMPVLRTSQPIDKIGAILRVPEVPLPGNATGSADSSNDSNGRAKTRSWTNYEDQRLLAGLHRFGLDDWQRVAAFVGNGRTKSQCCQRWNRGLNPKISKSEWTADLDKQLLQLVALHGEKSWTRVANEFGNRCDVQCRYRYKQLQKDENFSTKMSEAREATQALIQGNPPVVPNSGGVSRSNRTHGKSSPQVMIPATIPQWSVPQYSVFPPMAPIAQMPQMSQVQQLAQMQQHPQMQGMPQIPSMNPTIPGMTQHGYLMPVQQFMPQKSFQIGMFTPMQHVVLPPPPEQQQQQAQVPQPMQTGEQAPPEQPPTSTQPNQQMPFDDHVSPQSSMFDWPSLRGSSSMSGLFGISPMPSLGFGT